LLFKNTFSKIVFYDKINKYGGIPLNNIEICKKVHSAMYYLCERAAAEYWFETARAKGIWKVDISYDPRNMSTIYLRGADGTVDVCWLAEWQDKYLGKCLYEIDFLNNTEKLMKRKNAPKEMTSKADLTAAIDSVISEAEEMVRQTVVPKSKSERTKNIRANRAAEKEQHRKEEAFMFGEAKNQTPSAPNVEKDENISPYQLSYVTGSNAGEGLLFYGNTIIPTVDRFPKETKIYQILTTRLSEMVSGV